MSRACGPCRPTYRLGDKDRQKYAQIGESDRFTLKFVKPKNVQLPAGASPHFFHAAP